MISMKPHLRSFAFFTGFCTALVAQAQAPEVVTSFASAPPNARYAFASWTPRTLGELLQGNKSGDAVNVVGHLFLPPGSDKVPAVVLVHGSGGIYNAPLDFWPMLFIHGDDDDGRRQYLRAASRTKAECPLEIEIDTLYAHDRATAARLQGDAYTAAPRNCGAVGATVAGNARARDKAAQAAVAFLKMPFAN